MSHYGNKFQLLLLCDFDVLVPHLLKKAVYLGIVSREAVTKRKAFRNVPVDSCLSTFQWNPGETDSQ